jgi:ATP-dependent Zn protease
LQLRHNGASTAQWSAMADHADPVAKVTILPAGQTLGVTEQLPPDERHLYGEDYPQESVVSADFHAAGWRNPGA